MKKKSVNRNGTNRIEVLLADDVAGDAVADEAVDRLAGELHPARDQGCVAEAGQGHDCAGAGAARRLARRLGGTG